MKILVLGAGKMGSFFLDLLSFDHETAVYEKDPKRMRFTYNCQRLTTLDEVRGWSDLIFKAISGNLSLIKSDILFPTSSLSHPSS